jgi:hypothetical protein
MSSLKILCWNVFLRPQGASGLFLFPDGQSERAFQIGEKIASIQKELDVVVFNELFDKRSQALIKQQLSTYFPYSTRVVGDSNLVPDKLIDSPKIVNGGVQLFSRYPLYNVEFELYKDGYELEGSDKLSASGFLFVSLDVGVNKRVHIIASHFQSGEEYDLIRERQMTKIYNFISNQRKQKIIQESEVVLLAADFNKSFQDAAWVDSLEKNFVFKPAQIYSNKTHPSTLLENLPSSMKIETYSYDQHINNLIGRDGYPKLSPQTIDNVLVFGNTSSLDWNKSFYTPLSILSDKTLEFGYGLFLEQSSTKGRIKTKQLSDHFAVLASFHISYMGQQNKLIESSQRRAETIEFQSPLGLCFAACNCFQQ